MKRTKTQKGITLIALIITIIVLLILAVVTIGAIQNDGIIKKAVDAKTKYTEAQAKEKVALGIQDYMLEKNGAFNVGDFVSNIGKYVTGATPISADTVLVEGYKVKVNSNGSLEIIDMEVDELTREEYEEKYADQIATALQYGQLLDGVYTLKSEYLASRDNEESDPHGNLPASATTFALPYGTTTIGTNDFEFTSGGTFLLQSNITEVILPSTLTTIPDSAFESCNSLSKVNIPSSVTSIGSGAFGLTAIESVVIPEGITEIKSATFTLCSNLKNVILPSTVTHIDTTAFDGCAFETITLPEGLESMQSSAFANCTNLKEIYIPASVRNIGVDEMSTVFNGCTSLKNVYIESENCNIKYDAFTGIAEGSTIYVRSKAIADHLEEYYEYPEDSGVPEEYRFVYKYDKNTTTISTDYNWVYNR